jgi:hypothetical protein
MKSSQNRLGLRKIKIKQKRTSSLNIWKIIKLMRMKTVTRTTKVISSIRTKYTRLQLTSIIQRINIKEINSR